MSGMAVVIALVALPSLHLPESHAGAAAVFIDELDAGLFEGGAHLPERCFFDAGPS
jgi:hypothetical protein